MKKIIAVFFILFFSSAFAEMTGTISFSATNVSVTTGLIGYTVNLCNATSTCSPIGTGLSCFTDYDDTSSGTSAGWCNATSIASCYHNNSELGSGTNICITNTTYRTCSSAAWSGVSNCSSGQTCGTQSGTPGNCTTPSLSTTSTGGGTTASSSAVALITFTSSPLDFDIVQGEQVVKYATVKNSGNVTLYNVTLSIPGISWYTVGPVKVNRLNKTHEVSFSINFTIPEDLDVKTYSISLKATTHTSSASASKSFNINVKPSNRTIEEQIIPDFGEYSALLLSLESKTSELEASGVNTEEIRNLLLDAKNKLAQANSSIGQGDYATAKQIIDDAKGLLAAAQNEVNTASMAVPSVTGLGNLTFIIIIIAVAGIIIVVLYMLIPVKGEKKSWSPPQEKSSTSGKLKNIFKRKKDKSKW